MLNKKTWSLDLNTLMLAKIHMLAIDAVNATAPSSANKIGVVKAENQSLREHNKYNIKLTHFTVKRSKYDWQTIYFSTVKMV